MPVTGAVHAAAHTVVLTSGLSVYQFMHDQASVKQMTAAGVSLPSGCGD